jgi:hypothetical protein
VQHILLQLVEQPETFKLKQTDDESHHIPHDKSIVYFKTFLSVHKYGIISAEVKDVNGRNKIICVSLLSKHQIVSGQY